MSSVPDKLILINFSEFQKHTADSTYNKAEQHVGEKTDAYIKICVNNAEDEKCKNRI